MKLVFLKRGKDGKIRNGYPWIFHDEVEKIIGDPEFGDIVNVFSHDSDFLGKAFYGKRIRMLTREDEEIDSSFFENRLLRALKRREPFVKPYYRLFHAEADGIPGLVIDRYGDGFVVQFRNRGIQRFREKIVEAIVGIFSPSFVHERSDFETDIGEGVDRMNETLHGKVSNVTIEENGLKFNVDVVRGQKTGFFYDQRKNRMKVREFKGERALDLYTYTGGFALNLAAAGFEVIGVDVSRGDLEMARENAKLNGLKVEFIEADVFEFLDSTHKEFDLIVADPPSLIKSKKERRKAVSIFSSLVSKISKVLRNEGVLVLCSCAHHADESVLIESLRRGVESAGAIWRILDITFQDVDHPWIAQTPETLYLRCVWAVKEERW